MPAARDEIGRAMNRTQDKPANHYRRWTPDELASFPSDWPKPAMSSAHLECRYGRKISALRGKAQQLKMSLIRPKPNATEDAA